MTVYCSCLHAQAALAHVQRAQCAQDANDRRSRKLTHRYLRTQRQNQKGGVMFVDIGSFTASSQWPVTKTYRHTRSGRSVSIVLTSQVDSSISRIDGDILCSTEVAYASEAHSNATESERPMTRRSDLPQHQCSWLLYWILLA